MRGGHRFIVAAALVAVVTAVAGCSSSTAPSATKPAASSTTATTPPPAGLPAFYSLPTKLKSGTPGAVVKYEKVAAPSVHGTVYRVMYVSTTVHGEAIPVTGIIVVPNGRPPAAGWPVVSWAHGTNGMADICTPSLDPATDAPLANQLLDSGWEVVAADYQGEGSAGILPYIAGESAGRNVIDMVRAAHEMPDAKVSDDYVIWGHSEGGHTAMFGLKLAAEYGKGLTLKGVVAGAPPSQFNLIYAFLQKSPYRYYLLMAAAGLNAAYGNAEAPLDEILAPQGIALLPQLDQKCAGDLATSLTGIDISSVTKTDPFSVPKWKAVLEANDPQQFTSAVSVPLLIIQGGNDEQIPVVSTQILAGHLCGLGQNLERWVYPGQSHAGVIVPSATDMIHWIKDRFAATGTETVTDPYVPTGQQGIDITRCNAK